MKKVIFGLIAVLAVFAVVACGTPAPAPEPEPAKPAPVPETVEKALEVVYESHQGQLDLTGATKHSVAKGDTLLTIAQKAWGTVDAPNAGDKNAYYFPVIILASPDVGIVDPDEIETNQTFTIPDLKRNLDNSSTRQVIKDTIKGVAGVYSAKASSAGAKEKQFKNFAAKLETVADQL